MRSCSWAFCAATASWFASAVRSDDSFGLSSRPAGQVRGEQADELLAGDERHRESGLDLRATDPFANRGQPQIGLRVLDMHHPLHATGTEGELEQSLGHHRLRVGEMPAGRRTQPEPVADVHRHAVRAEQLRDAGCRRLQRVRQRELCDRLAQYLEQSLSVLQFERRGSGALAGTKRLRRADGKDTQAVQLALRRRDARCKNQLDDAELGIPQAQRRHRSARPVGEGLDPDRLPFVRHDAGLRGSRAQRLRRARLREELERAGFIDGPEQRGLGACRQRRHSDHFFGAPRLVEPGRERISRERQPVGGDRARSEPVARAEGAQNEPEVGRREPGGRDLRRLESACAAIGLEAAERPGSSAGGKQQHAARMNQAPRPADRFGKVVHVGVVAGQLGGRKARAGELGSKRLGAADDSAHAEHPVLARDPDRDCVRPGHLGGRPSEAVERLVEPTLVGRAPPRCGERLEPLLGDAVHSPRERYPRQGSPGGRVARLCSRAWPSRLGVRKWSMSRWSSIRPLFNTRTSCIEPGVALVETTNGRRSAHSFASGSCSSRSSRRAST